MLYFIVGTLSTFMISMVYISNYRSRCKIFLEAVYSLSVQALEVQGLFIFVRDFLTRALMAFVFYRAIVLLYLIGLSSQRMSYYDGVEMPKIGKLPQSLHPIARTWVFILVLYNIGDLTIVDFDEQLNSYPSA